MSKIAATPPTTASLTQSIAREENRIATNFKKGLLTEGEAAEAKRALEGVKSELASFQGMDQKDTFDGAKDLGSKAETTPRRRPRSSTWCAPSCAPSTRAWRGPTR
jgi:hypothetical protein